MKKIFLTGLFILSLSSINFADSVLIDVPKATQVVPIEPFKNPVRGPASDEMKRLLGIKTDDDANDDSEEFASVLAEQIENASCITEYSVDTLVEDMDTVTFGNYSQGGSTKKPIEWIVLEKNDNNALLITKNAIENRTYADSNAVNYDFDGIFYYVQWNESTLRKWLNNTFINEAFNENEKSMLLISNKYSLFSGDKIFIPNTQCLKEYFDVDSLDFMVENIVDGGMEYFPNERFDELVRGLIPFEIENHNNKLSCRDQSNNITKFFAFTDKGEIGFIGGDGGGVSDGGQLPIMFYYEFGVRPIIWVSLANNSGNVNNYEVVNQTQANNIQETTKPFNAKYAEFSGNVVTYDQINWDDELTRKTLEGLGSLKKTTDENNQDAKETNQTQANNIHETIKPAPKNGWVGDYYYQNDVSLKNTWVDYGSDKYYCGPNGAILKNQWIDNTYYVDNTGKMLKNTTTPDGYKVGVDGKYITETNINVSETESIEQNSKNSTVLDNNFIIINEKTEELANKKLQSITKVNFDSKDIIMEITSLEFSGKVIVNVSSDNNWIKAEWNDKGSYWRAISNYKITNDDDKVIFLQEVNKYILNMHKNDTANDFNNSSNKSHRTARSERLSKLWEESIFKFSFDKSDISNLSAKQKKDGLFGLFGKEIYNVNFKYNGDKTNKNRINDYNTSHDNAVIVDCFDKKIRKLKYIGNNTYELEVYTKERADEIVNYINDGNTYTVYFYDRPNTKFSTHVATKRDKGFRFSNGHRRYTKEDGKEITNEWLETDKRKYYFDKNGDAVTGDVTIDDKTYLFDDSGSLKTEDANNGNYHYVIDPSTYEVQETIDIHEYKKQTNPVLPEGAIEPVQGAIDPITDDTESESKGSIIKATETPGAISGKFNNFMNNNQAKEAESVAKDFFDNYIKDKIVKGSKDWMFRREIAIVKWMVENCEYDWDNYNNGSIPKLDGSAYAALVNKKAVCSGFANGFAYLCEVCEIPVKYLSGINHAWNMVKLDDGQWYHVDSTWSLCRSEYSNFTNLTDEECKNLINGAGGENNHASWDDTSNIANSDKYGHEYVIKYLNDTYGINDRYTGYITPKTNTTTVQQNAQPPKKTVAAAGDYKKIDFADFEDKSGHNMSRIYSKKDILKSGKHLLGKVQVKLYQINKNYVENMKIYGHFLELKNNKGGSTNNLLDINSNEWQELNMEKVLVTESENEDRKIGFSIAWGTFNKNGVKVDQNNLTSTFNMKSGTYEGESYDAICQIKDGNELIYVALVKDLMFDINK